MFQKCSKNCLLATFTAAPQCGAQTMQLVAVLQSKLVPNRFVRIQKIHQEKGIPEAFLYSEHSNVQEKRQ